MAHLLNPKPDISIEERLERSFSFSAARLLFYLLCFVILFLIAVLQYRVQSRELFLLNDFYISLEEADKNLFAYTLSSSENAFHLFEESMQKTKSSLEKLEALCVNRTFSRDMTDAYHILNSYADHAKVMKQKALERYTDDNFSQEKMNELYRTSKDMILFFSENYQSLYEMILDKGTKRTRHLDKNLVLLIAAFIAFLICDLISWRYRFQDIQIREDLKQLQYQTMQSQMNPHFLFNTLNMIAQFANLHEDVQTAELLQDTAYLLRYTLDMSDRCVTLFQEVEALEKYVGLQEQRFGSRIEFYFDLDESFHDVRVPNLILQPLVENAISHGLGMCTEGGKIRIRTFREKEKGCLSVSDNGSGMDHETLEALIRSIRQKEVRGNQIGLHNVYHRLMIFFSDNASLTITSRKGEGTEVVIRIPLDDDTKQKKENG
ncbi:MAG: histidine kinase [Blautia sp.]|nr:histidine kinase [Blautia sp.]